ncbi:membrane protein [Bacillus manliponensis]|uniref:Membrane protein n=1 Tax=Bacillus manliponensis TaxID=574376 RepID=A0A073JTG2_9BACI|nr:DMT family transporter [Bacillus manliponensis]KEK17451.1 membrane protein [Bacillus manliponensis]
MKRWGIELLLVTVVIIWGTNYTIGKYGIVELSVIDFTALRVAVAAPLLLLLTFYIEKSLRIDKRDIFRLIVVSIVGITLYQTLFMETIKYTSATNASLLISISPIFTAVFVILLKQETFSVRKGIGSLFACVGAALVLLSGTSLSNSLYGNVIGLVTSICWGIYPVLAAPLMKKYSALRVTAWSTAIAAVPLMIMSGPSILQVPFHIEQSSTWFSLAYSIFFVTVYGLVVWYIGVQKIGASHTMVYMYVTPFVAVVFAAMWAKEHVSLQQLIGGLIIFLGLWFVKSEKKTKNLIVSQNISK